MTVIIRMCMITVLSSLQVTTEYNYSRYPHSKIHIRGHRQCRYGTHTWTSPDKTSGVVNSPNYPSPYPRGTVTDCIWEIHAPSHHVIRIKFTTFLLDYNCADYVELYRGNKAFPRYQIGKRLCRRDNPFGPITTPGNYLEMYFHARSWGSYKGFRAEYTFIATSEPTTTTRRPRAPHHPIHPTTTTRTRRIPSSTILTPVAASPASTPHPPTAHLDSYVIIGVVVAMVGMSCKM